MTTRCNTWPALALAACIAVLPLLGCDNDTSKADRKVMDGVANIGVAYTAEDVAKNITDLEALSKEADLSPARRALVKAALANAELEAGKRHVRDLQQQEVLIAGKLSEMEQLAGQMRKSKTLIDAAQRRNPAEPLPAAFAGEKSVSDALTSKAAAARGQGDAAWIKHDTAPLATITGVKAKITDLQGQIGKIQSGIDNNKKQRDAALAEAGNAQQEAVTAKGDESTRSALKGIDLRKQAALLNIQIEASEAQLVPLKHDLAAARAHETAVTATAEAFDKTAKTYTEEYAKIGQTIDQMTAAAKSLLDGDKESLKSKAIELNALLATAGELRTQATDRMKAAVTHYAEAITDSDAVKQGKREVKAGSPEALLDKARTDAHEASGLRLRQAEGNAALAAVYAAQAQQLARRKTVMEYAASAATPLALSLPAELNDPQTDELLRQARADADEKYKAADELLQSVIEGATGSDATRNAARLMRAVVSAGWSQLAGVAGDTETAKTRLAAAVGYYQEVAGQATGTPIPPYLLVITDQQPVAPTTAPATAPSTPAARPPAATPEVERAPTTNPATGGN